ncbi:hypothetical protein FB446DRAFT_804780 [Lentinula raphanica]|nr:hypothetical protein FB446DRAFT_804780 [Lentinula raphanica]
MVDETEALKILAAQKESLRRPISPFDAAHSSDEERRHIARAETISKATSHPLPLGARPDPTRPSRINEPGSPPPAKKLKDNNYLSTISFVRTSTSRPRKTPTPAHSPPPHAPRSQHSPREEEEEEVSNPWGTVNGRAPAIYTTPSDEGQFPWVSGLSLDSFGEGQDPAQLKEWLREALESPNDNFALMWYADDSHLSPTQRRANAKHLISGRTNLPKEEVRSSPPNPVMKEDGTTQGAPKYDLLRGVTADAVCEVLTESGQAVIAEGGKAVFLSCFPPMNDHFLALIEGLTFENNEEEAEECAEFIRHALRDNAKIKQLILTKAPVSTPPLPPNVVFGNWLDSLYVTPLVIGRSGPKPDPDAVEPEEPLFDIGWRLFGRPFTNSVPHQKKLQLLLRSLRLSHPHMGMAVFKTQPYRCGICRGVDHPIGLCPFPEMNEWFGPTLQSIREADARQRSQNSRGRSRGRGNNRGRGSRGRGN